MKEPLKNQLRKELKNLFKSMDFLCDNFINKEGVDKKEFQLFFNIYRQLGLAWEFLGLQCGHWEGYKKTRNKKEACKICGKINGADESYYLLPMKGSKKIGRKPQPNSKKTFKNEKEATIVDDTIDFHGATLNVDVHNAYKSKVFGDDHDINIAPERIVALKENGIECSISQYSICLNFKKKNIGKKKYGAFPWEMKKKDLKKFPVIFEFDEKGQFLEMTILR